MDILTVIGSPKGKGNGYKIAKKIESMLMSYEKVNMDYIFLKDFNLKQCIGCFQCVKKGIDLCPINDSFHILEEKIEKSDGIILVSPGYVYNVSWLMKNFIDRFAYTNHRPRYFDKKLMLIANAGSGMEETIKAMRNTLGAGPEIVSEIPYLTPAWELKDQVKHRLNKMLLEESRRFYTSMKNSNKPVPSIQNYVRFRLFKKVSVEVKKYFPADYEYYKNKKDYYYEIKINYIKKIIGEVLLKFISFKMKDLEPKERIT